MDTIVVNDTNIFIDLLAVDLLEVFLGLPWKVHTTDTVLHEIKVHEQYQVVDDLIQQGRIKLATFSSDEVLYIAELQMANSHTNVSFTDCSVWYYAKVNHYILLTGDRKLRSAAKEDKVEVHGILFVFDKLVDYHVISADVAIIKLNELIKNNPRLPKSEIEIRLKQWAAMDK